MTRRLEISTKKVFLNLEKYDRTSLAAARPALDEAYKENRIKTGDLLIKVALGGDLI